MRIDSNSVITGDEVKDSFSAIAGIARKNGRAVVMENDQPKFLVIDLDLEPQIEMTEQEKLEFVAARILREHRAAFEELAR